MIKLSGVTKVFDHRGIAGVHDLSLVVPKGKILALMGPNGCGKTTLLNLISKKIVPEKGEVEFHGHIHFFETRIPDSSLNVQKFLIQSVKKDMPEEKKIQLSRDMADVFEFTFQLRQNMGQLSQGQLQKVLMAAELIDSPEILFLDEPFIHLDPMTRGDILFSLFQFIKNREMTVIWITHEKDEALKFSDSIALMQHGRIEQVDSPLKILEKPRNLYVAQFFGHKNFIKLSGQNGVFQTPWGSFTSSLMDKEAFLVIPPMAWRMDENSDFEFKILSIYPQYFAIELELERDDKYFKVSFPLSQVNQFKVGNKIKLSGKLSQCFLISL